MSRQATSFILAYHGCDADIARQVVTGKTQIKPSEKSYDWLGSGIYFWESDAQRAWEWADDRVRQGKCKEAGVLGAAIDLGNCLDLLARPNIELVKQAYDDYKFTVKQAGSQMLQNTDPKTVKSGDKLLRQLDCAVINWLHARIDDPDSENFSIAPFDTVRGVFQEDAELYPGAGFRLKTHIQIAVREPSCIRGFFLEPRPN